MLYLSVSLSCYLWFDAWETLNALKTVVPNPRESFGTWPGELRLGCEIDGFQDFYVFFFYFVAFIRDTLKAGL